MDRIVGCLDFINPEEGVKAVIAQMMSAYTEAEGLKFRKDVIDEKYFALSVFSFNQLESDWRLIWPDRDLMVYLSGYLHVDEWAIFSETEEDLIAGISLEIFKWILTNETERFKNLGGSFIILFYDRTRQTLNVLTDKLGSRPLFYACKPGGIFFASDVQALLQNCEIGRSLDLRSVTEYLRLGMVFEDRTLYEAIRSVPSASILKVNRNELHIETYWSMVYDESWKESDKDYVEALVEGFKSATDRLTNNLNTAALMLSGGIDSRMMAASLIASGNKVKVVSFGGFDNDEVKIARAVAKECDLTFSFLKRVPNYYQMVFPKTVHIGSGLFHFYHAHVLGLHEQIHAQGINTLLHGWGLDLLFSATYLPKRVINYLKDRSFNLIWPRNLANQEDVIQGLLTKLVLPIDDLTAKLPGKNLKGIWHSWPLELITILVEKSKCHARDYYNRFEWVLLQDISRFRSFLFPLSMRWGCKERCPLYDSRILEVYLRMPPRLRFCSRAYGRALEMLSMPLAKTPYSRTGVSIRSPEIWQTLAYFLLPTVQAVRLRERKFAGRYEGYPEEWFNSYPVTEVLFREESFKSMAQDLFSSGVLSDLGLVDQDVLKNMLEHHFLGSRNYADELSGYLSLAHWLMHWTSRPK